MSLESSIQNLKSLLVKIILNPQEEKEIMAELAILEKELLKMKEGSYESYFES